MTEKENIIKEIGEKMENVKRQLVVTTCKNPKFYQGRYSAFEEIRDMLRKQDTIDHEY